MKSKAFHSFKKLSDSLLFNQVIKTPYYIDLKKRLNIFTSEEKRSLLIKQKIDYIFLNFDINYYEVIIDYKINTIKITNKNKIYIPFKNQDKNFFDIIFSLSEIIVKDCLNKKNNYGNEFSSIYFNILKKVYKVNDDLIVDFYKKLKIEGDKTSIIYEGFKEKDAFDKIKNKHNLTFNRKILDCDFINKTILENDVIEIIICKFRHNKIKVFEIYT